MNTAIPIISILSSAAVAVILHLLSTRAEVRRSRWQGNFARFDELRSVLDEALIALADAVYEANGVLSMLEQGLGDGDQRLEFLKKLENNLNRAGEFKERIALRLGREAPLSETYAAAYLACWEAWEVFTQVLWQEEEFNAERREKATRVIEQAGELHDTFVERASSIVGPDLSQM